MPEATEGTGGPVRVELAAQPALDLDACCQKLPRADQVYRGLAWRLERDPKIGAVLPLRDPSHPNAEIRIVKTKLSRFLPTVALIYRLEETGVTIIRLKAWPPGYDATL